MVGERRVMQEALFYGFSLERHVPNTRRRRPAILSAPWAGDKSETGWDRLASHGGDSCGSAEERAFDQKRLTSQPRDLTVCRFRLRGRRLSGNVVALLTSRAALLPRAAQGAFCE
jgi:hypothetical protein